MSAYPPTGPDKTPYEANESPLTDSSTLYERSPYASMDAARRKRKAEAESRRKAYGERHPLFFGTARQIRNPNLLTLLIIMLGIAYVYLPLSSVRSWLPRYSSPISRASAGISTTSIMPAQKTFTLNARTKGCHLVQSEVESELRDILKPVKAGILTLFIQHTSAALSLNENFDRDVRTDMDMALDRVIPESLPWRHTDEGPDDSASHTKASIIGPSVTIPITEGRLNLGTWQGVYLCEFRRAKHSRRIVATVLP
ncbi:Rho GTPase activating protein [Malassezia yamatoensis]|uniref:Rho GTPase activating protein n=1 Tax=Malassezia yamatoensis TaxID=253288 RepID=A0AAJ6CJD0_9BASI|nr:Rho GTPase activating protein [Malassezia yamatoensis]